MSVNIGSQNKKNMSNFHLLEVMGRGSKTQVELVEKINKIT